MSCICGQKFHYMLFTEKDYRRNKKPLLQRDANMRVCTNPECKRYRVIQNRCKGKHGWFDAEGNGLICPECKKEFEMVKGC